MFLETSRTGELDFDKSISRRAFHTTSFQYGLLFNVHADGSNAIKLPEAESDHELRQIEIF